MPAGPPAIVIYISLEGGKLARNRVIKAREELKLPPDIPFALVTCPLDMRTSDDDAIRLANTIRQAISERSGQNLRVRLVVIDTMSRALNGGAENAEDMGLLLKHTDYVRRETGVAVRRQLLGNGDRRCVMLGLHAPQEAVLRIIEESRSKITSTDRIEAALDALIEDRRRNSAPVVEVDAHAEEAQPAG